MTGSQHHSLELSEKDNGHSRIDTKSKLVIVFLYILLSIFFVTFEQLVFGLILGIVLQIAFASNFINVLKKSIIPLPLILSLSILAYFSDIENNTLTFSNVNIIYSRTELALFYFIRSYLIIIVAISLVESEESFFEVVYALDDLGMPSALVSILLLMYRSTLDLHVEAKRMIDVRYSRSTYRRWGTNFYTYQILGYMLGNIVVRSLLRRNQRKDALYSRNFKGTLCHKKKEFRFNGLLLLWITAISLVFILLATETNFVDIGEKWIGE